MTGSENEGAVKIYRDARITAVCNAPPCSETVVSMFVEAAGETIRLDLTEDAIERLPAVAEYASRRQSGP